MKNPHKKYRNQTSRTFLFLPARSVPTRASNMLAHRSSANRTPNFTCARSVCSKGLAGLCVVRMKGVGTSQKTRLRVWHFSYIYFSIFKSRQSVQFFCSYTHTDCFRHVASNGRTTHRSLPICTFRTETLDLFDELFDLFFYVQCHLCVRVARARRHFFS